jgi:uncharacterized membrane protein YdjX (TVP38/TMEM64 family)
VTPGPDLPARGYLRGVESSRPVAFPVAGVAITLAGAGAIALLVLTVEPLREAVGAALRGDSEDVRDEVDELGAVGPLFILLLCLIHAVVWYPAEIVDAAAGFAYGFWPALALCMGGWLLNGLAAYEIGRHVARPVLYRAIGTERLVRAERMVHNGGITLLLGVRLVPILPFSLVSYAAGAAHVPTARFVWTTMVGYLPITAISILLGTRLEDFSPTDPVVLGSVAALLALLLFARLVVPRGGD